MSAPRGIAYASTPSRNTPAKCSAFARYARARSAEIATAPVAGSYVFRRRSPERRSRRAACCSGGSAA
ncbi:MAG: hypothetical protein QM704_10615 [Anaeromyxobacteraceae bacterium]